MPRNDFINVDGTINYDNIKSVQDFNLDITNKTATHHRLNVVDSFGADNTGVNDSTSALQAARDYIASQAQPSTLVFPAGIYKYSVSPNWAIQDAQIIADGEVRLRYTGTGNAVILDGVVGKNSNVYNMVFGKFIIEAPSTALDGLFIKCVHHSFIDVNVKGCGSTSSGVEVGFTVCNEFRITVSRNEENVWYLNARPLYGLRFSKLIAGQIPSYNTFINPIIEHAYEGMQLDDSLGNIFIGGTVEGCDDYGVILGAAAGLNKFCGMDLEANATIDVQCGGFENQFYGIDSTKLVDFGATAKNNSIIGGSFKSISLENGSSGNLVNNAKYNRDLGDGTTGTISDSGSNNRLVNNFNVKLSRQENRPPSASYLGMTGTPFVYTNTTGNDVDVFLLSGTISNITYTKSGLTSDTIVWTIGTFLRMCPGDSVSITYSVAGTIRIYTT